MFTIWRHQLLCGQAILGKLLLNNFSRSAFGHFNAEYFEILEAKPHKSVFVLKVGRRCNGMTVALVGNKYWHYICRRGGPDGIVHKMLITGRVQDMLIGVSTTWGCNMVQYCTIGYNTVLVQNCGHRKNARYADWSPALCSPQSTALVQYGLGTSTVCGRYNMIHYVTLWCVGTNYVAHHGITLI